MPARNDSKWGSFGDPLRLRMRLGRCPATINHPFRQTSPQPTSVVRWLEGDQRSACARPFPKQAGWIGSWLSRLSRADISVRRSAAGSWRHRRHHHLALAARRRHPALDPPPVGCSLRFAVLHQGGTQISTRAIGRACRSPPELRAVRQREGQHPGTPTEYPSGRPPRSG